MALNNDAVLSISTAKFYTATTGTEVGESAGWEEMGHTSIDSVLAFESEGGDTNTLGSLQVKQLRTSRTPIVDHFRVDLQQFDEGGLKLYFGSNATTGADGMLEVPANPVPTTKAWKMVAVDGEREFVVYAPKAEIFRAEGASFSNEEALSTLPLSVRPLSVSDDAAPYKLTVLGAA